MLRLCHTAGFEPRIVQEANEISTICAIVAAGLGVAVVPSSATTIALNEVVYREIEDAGAELERWAVWRDGVTLGAVTAFVSSLPDAQPVV